MGKLKKKTVNTKKTVTKIVPILAKSFFFHINLQTTFRFLVIEVYKNTSYLNPKFMCSFFTLKEIPYNLGRVKRSYYLLHNRHIVELTPSTFGET